MCKHHAHQPAGNRGKQQKASSRVGCRSGSWTEPHLLSVHPRPQIPASRASASSGFDRLIRRRRRVRHRRRRIGHIHPTVRQRSIRDPGSTATSPCSPTAACTGPLPPSAGRPAGRFRLIAVILFPLFYEDYGSRPKLPCHFDARTPEQPSVRRTLATASPPAEPEIAGCGRTERPRADHWTARGVRSFADPHSRFNIPRFNSLRLAPPRRDNLQTRNPGAPPPLPYPVYWQSARAPCSAARRPRRTGRRADLPTLASSWHQPWNRTAPSAYNARLRNGTIDPPFQRNFAYGKGWQEEGRDGVSGVSGDGRLQLRSAA